MADWGTLLNQYMICPEESDGHKNSCIGAAVIGKDFALGKTVPAGTVWWAAACKPTDADTGIDTEAAWAKVYKEDGEQPIMQDDGSEKNVHIVEVQTVLNAITHDMKSGPLPNGLWLGGQKHALTLKDIETGNNNEYKFLCLIAVRKGEKGHVIVCTDADCAGKCCIVTAEFDKAAGHPSSMAKTVALEFAKWLKDEGTDKSDTIAL